jgi:hypothetical protein
MTITSQSQVAAARKRIEAEIEGEIDSLEATRSLSLRRIGVTQAPQNAVQGKRTMGSCARYGATKVWNRRTRQMLKVE